MTTSIVPSSQQQLVNPVTTLAVQSPQPSSSQSSSSLSQFNHQRSGNQITIPVNHQQLTNQSANESNLITSSSGVPTTMHHQTVSTVTRPVPGHRSASYTNAVSVFGHNFNRPILPPPHLRLVPGHRSRPAPRPPGQQQPVNNYHNYVNYHHQRPPPPIPPFPRMVNSSVPINHPLALHSNHSLLIQEAINNCFGNVPVPPPPYSTLPTRGNRRNVTDHGHVNLTASISAPISSVGVGHCQNIPVATNANNPQASVNCQSNSALSYLPSFLRNLVNSGNNGSGANCSDTEHGNNHSPNGSNNSNNSLETMSSPIQSLTPTGHRPLPPVLPSYHHLYASSSPSSIRRRRRRMRHSRINEDTDPSNYLTENRKQLICISLLVIGSILAFIGLVTVSLFAISFGVTFGLFSFILYRLLPTSKYAPSLRSSPRRLSPRISIGGHPYVISAGGHGDNCGHFPPPPPSYQEAISGQSSMSQLNPNGLITISGHQNNSNNNFSGHSNQGFDSSPPNVQQIIHHHRQESSISSNSSHSSLGHDGNGSMVRGTGVTVVNVESGTVTNAAIESCPKSVIAVGFSEDLIDGSIEEASIHDSKCGGDSKVNGPESGPIVDMNGHPSEKSGSNKSNNSPDCGHNLNGNGQLNRSNCCTANSNQESGSRNHHRCPQQPQFITIIEATI